ncbi:hypothetical protein [Variovorax sp. CF079]|uniref:hypothetical protein n=1 Tax=Variovorax sp. CF079 TaxID=1882774 RepID=UPI0011132FF5|nr:hypothetical protein [Variovorax sp. CF079]
MSNESISFPGLLYAVLLREKTTPTRLAINTGIPPANVVSWLRDGQLPKAASVWKLTAGLPRHRGQLFAAALQSFHSRTEETYKPGKQLRWDKTVSTYMGEGFDRIPPGDQEQFTELWRDLLAERVKLALPVGAETPIESSLILLPVPSIVILDDWREIAKSIANQSIQLVDLPWKKFEDLVGHLLESFGWEVLPMGLTLPLESVSHS